MLPLGEQPGGRAGRHPVEDAQAYPLAGRVVEGVTGERVCVRRELDLGAVRDSLQARACAAPSRGHHHTIACHAARV